MQTASGTEAFVSPSEIEKQKEYISLVREILFARFADREPKAYVHTYGCQGNVSDSERIKGVLRAMGYVFCDDAENADLVLFNTCAVREHAEDRVFGNVGALKPIKEKRPGMIIALCGCMMQQKHVSDRIQRSYPYVNLVFGTFASHKLPGLLYRVLSAGKRVVDVDDSSALISEGLPVFRDRSFKAWLPVMYGCDNFCSYCIVPYVRGRERSRRPEDILAEAKALIASGAKDITLLGQNVNSYGKKPDFGVDFADILEQINSIDGDFIIRFMTSHPKDCSHKLLDTMARCDKVAKHLHLPFQSGNNEILRQMNRGYTAEDYLEVLDYARKVMPDLSVTTDVIVGFPGETYEQFSDTLALMEKARFTSLFTFIYSKREGTKAAKLPDPVNAQEKSARFKQLCDLQEQIAHKRTAGCLGKVFRVLIEESDGQGMLTGRTEGNISISFPGSSDMTGTFANVRVTQALTWILRGELV